MVKKCKLKNCKLQFAYRNKENWNMLKEIAAIIPFRPPATLGALHLAIIVDDYIESLSSLPIINHRYHRFMISNTLGP